MLLYILLLRRHHRRARAASRTMWTRSWIDWRQRQGVGPICKYSKRAGYGRSRNARVHMRVCVCVCDIHQVNIVICVCVLCRRACMHLWACAHARIF